MTTYRRVDGIWTDETEFRYIPSTLAAALEVFDFADQRLNGSAESRDRLGEHLEVVITRCVPGGSAPAPGSRDSNSGFAEGHGAPSVLDAPTVATT